jgi:uncharacterized protein (DUF2336 family)
MSTATRADKRDRDRVTAIADGAALPLAKATPRVREEVAVAFGSEYAGGSVRPSQRRSAEAILKLFIPDTAESVRAAIARRLVTCPFLPLSLARTMAADIDAIAVPMIRGSEVFDDAALLDIVRSGVVARQVAVATRDTVSQPVAGALVGTGDASVVAALLANDGARIAPGDLAGVVRDFGDDPTIKGLVIGREVLPLEVLDSLLDSAGLAFGEILEDAMDLPGEIVKRVCTLAREQLTVSHVRERENLREVEELADRLGQQGRLTSTLLLRALYGRHAVFRHRNGEAVRRRGRCDPQVRAERRLPCHRQDRAQGRVDGAVDPRRDHRSQAVQRRETGSVDARPRHVRHQGGRPAYAGIRRPQPARPRRRPGADLLEACLNRRIRRRDLRRSGRFPG